MRLRWLLVALILVPLAVWWFTRDRLPDPVRVATGIPGGEYARVGEVFARNFTARTGHEVVLVPSNGSRANSKLLADDEVDFAIIQLGSVDHEEVSVVAPLYREPVHVVVRNGRGIESLGALDGRAVSIGPRGAGMRASARAALAHHGIGVDRISRNERYFKELLSDPELDAAVVTTGVLNPDLQEVMASGQFELVSLPLAAALSIREPYFDEFTIPRGTFRGDPPVPLRDTPTVATTAVFAVREDASVLLVEAALGAIYEEHMRAEIPSLIGPGDAREWDEAKLHRGVWAYHNPWDGIELAAQVFEGLAGVYELLFAVAAGLFLLWRRRRLKQEEEEKKQAEIEHERLDDLLDKTVVIERAQMDCRDPERLNAYLDEITEIKLEALEKLSREALRGDPRFLIFLTHCASLIGKIQRKLPRTEA